MNSIDIALIETKKIDLTYEKYIQRLKTFKIFQWFSKPNEFSPIECARHGWINFAKDTLKCTACSNLFYFYNKSQINLKRRFPITDFETNKEKNENYQDPKFLVEKHNQNCPWRTLIISDNLIQVDIYDEEKAYENFLVLKDSLKSCTKLPILVESIVQKFQYQNEFICYEENFSPKKSLKKGNNENKFNNLDILACCGWSYDEKKNILNCNKCLRSIAVWLYKREQVNQSDEDSTSQELDSNLEDNSILEESDLNSEHLIIKNIIDNLIDLIEVEGNRTFPKKTDIQSINSNTINKMPNFKSKKRKLSQINDSKKVIKTDNFKLFDPISEHFKWCPWLRTLKKDSNLNESQYENVCEANFYVINKYLLKKQQKSFKQIDSKTTSPFEKKNFNPVNRDFILDSQKLLEKVKSAKSILINSASQFSFLK